MKVEESSWDRWGPAGRCVFLTGQRDKSLKQTACHDGGGRDLVRNSQGGGASKLWSGEMCIRKI